MRGGAAAFRRRRPSHLAKSNRPTVQCCGRGKRACSPFDPILVAVCSMTPVSGNDVRRSANRLGPCPNPGSPGSPTQFGGSDWRVSTDQAARTIRSSTVQTRIVMVFALSEIIDWRDCDAYPSYSCFDLGLRFSRIRPDDDCPRRLVRLCPAHSGESIQCNSPPLPLSPPASW